MLQYRCQAIINGQEQCHHTCWGSTAYCMWHNCYLTWRMLNLMRKPLPRSMGWVPYDPNMIKDWKPATFVSITGLALVIAVIMPIIQLIRAVTTPEVMNNVPAVDFLLNTMWWSAIYLAVMMYFGNSHPSIPRLMLILAFVAFGIVSAALIVDLTNGLGGTRLFDVAGALGLVLFTLPPPKGPLKNSRADIRDPQSFPPLNVGSSVMRGLGIVLFLVYGLAKLSAALATVPA